MGDQPLKATLTQVHQNDSPDHTQESHQTDGLHAMRIIIANENTNHTLFIEALLHRSGFRNTQMIANGKELISELNQSLQLQQEEIDLVLISSTLDTNWQTLCKRINQSHVWRDIPLILIASDPEWFEASAKQAFNCGITDVIYTPLRPAHFSPRIYSALLLKKERTIRMINRQAIETELAERKVIDARLQHLVNHDDLTGLYSRRRLVKALSKALSLSIKTDQTVSLLHIDIDQFKVINDLEGHQAGDQLLVNIANLLRDFIDNDKTIARTSSDEYSILIKNDTPEAALSFSEKIRRAMKKFVFSIDDRVYNIGVSIGLAITIKGENISASEMLARADQACFVAKKHGRNMVHQYDNQDREIHQLRDEAFWAPKIKDALNNSRFCLMFQPIINLKTSQIEHYEALIRMYDDNNELISPDVFIPVAERIGMIHDIDNWVIKQAINALKQLPENKSYVSLNINLSSHAFHDPGLLQRIKDALAESQIEGKRITFEITETAAIENYEQTREMIIKLRELGCSFALDDFGVGFNSFSYLKKFPVDYLKIDGSFITNLVNDEVDQALVKSMVEISKTLGKKTVAEFVESEEILKMIKSYGIDYAQGYYIGKPGSEFEGIESVSFCPSP
ncbi:MAG: EAL domain-containing protein [Gammaproteobacteria bacterium]|nr:EAL domain-containing protein [Gammaproteobacteria bacterium]